MKKTKLFNSFLALFLCAAIAGCSDDDNKNTDDTSSVAFKVDVDGTAASLPDYSGYIDGSTATIVGDFPDKSTRIVMRVNGSVPGVYNNVFISSGNFASQTGYVSYNPFASGSKVYEGTVEITSVDTENKTMSGKFSFKGYLNRFQAYATEPLIRNYTNGEFKNIPYQSQAYMAEKSYIRCIEKIYNGTNLPLDYLDINTSIEGDDLSISMSSSGNSGMVFKLDKNIAEGTYSFPTDLTANTSNLNEGVTTAEEGVFKVLSNEDGWIRATFSFSGDDGKFNNLHSITDGYLNVKYE